MVIFLLPIFLIGCGYSEDFDKVTIPDEVPEAVLNGVVVLAKVHARTMGKWPLCD